MQIYFIKCKYLLRPFAHDSPPTLTPSLSIVWAPKFGHCRPNPILFLPRNHAFTIKTSASYLEKSLSTSKLLISALESQRHFVAFSCPPFCLIFYKPTMTVSFGKYRLSIIFSLIIPSANYVCGRSILFSRCPSVHPSCLSVRPWRFGFSLISWKGNDEIHQILQTHWYR